MYINHAHGTMRRNSHAIESQKSKVCAPVSLPWAVLEMMYGPWNERIHGAPAQGIPSASGFGGTPLGHASMQDAVYSCSGEGHRVAPGIPSASGFGGTLLDSRWHMPRCCMVLHCWVMGQWDIAV